MNLRGVGAPPSLPAVPAAGDAHARADEATFSFSVDEAPRARVKRDAPGPSESAQARPHTKAGDGVAANRGVASTGAGSTATPPATRSPASDAAAPSTREDMRMDSDSSPAVAADASPVGGVRDAVDASASSFEAVLALPTTSPLPARALPAGLDVAAMPASPTPFFPDGTAPLPVMPMPVPEVATAGLPPAGANQVTAVPLPATSTHPFAIPAASQALSRQTVSLQTPSPHAASQEAVSTQTVPLRSMAGTPGTSAATGMASAASATSLSPAGLISLTGAPSPRLPGASAGMPSAPSVVPDTAIASAIPFAPMPVAQAPASPGGVQSPGPALQAGMPSAAPPVLAVDTLAALALVSTSIDRGGAVNDTGREAATLLATLDTTAPAAPAAGMAFGAAAPRGFDAATALPVVPGAVALPASPDAGFDDAFGTKVVWMVEQRITQAEMRVSPEGVGPIEVRLQMDGARVSAQFSAAHPDVRQALEAGMGRLRDMLEQQGMQLADAHVGQGGSDRRPPSRPDRDRQPGGVDEAPLVTTVRGLQARGLIDLYA